MSKKLNQINFQVKEYGNKYKATSIVPHELIWSIKDTKNFGGNVYALVIVVIVDDFLEFLETIFSIEKQGFQGIQKVCKANAK